MPTNIEDKNPKATTIYSSQKDNDSQNNNDSSSVWKPLAVGAATLGLGYMALRKLTGGRLVSRLFNSAPKGKEIKVVKTVTVDKSARELYQYWRQLENLPLIMSHLKSVRTLGDDRSRWVADAPLGQQVEWTATIVQDLENRKIAWRSIEPSDVPNEGSVTFREASGNRGTEVRVELEYNPPAGKLGAGFAKLFGKDPKQQIADDLYRFKQKMETGQIATT